MRANDATDLDRCELILEMIANIERRAIYEMRNIIAHNYQSIEAAFIWRAATEQLGDLKAACAQEVERLSG